VSDFLEVPVSQDRAALVPVLHNIATRLRIDSIRATTAAGSGHPTTCMSAADLTAALFFAEMRFDPQHPKHAHNDRFVLSKGHAAPLLYAAWSAVGLVDRDELLTLRELHSDLEGHPTPRLPFVDVATGSLGQGLAAGIGIALNARRIKSSYRTYVLMGDGETAEGSVWEAAESGAHFALDNLVGITDVNRLGQSRPTIWQHDLGSLARRWSGFGWHTLEIDGHDLNAILDALAEARATRGRPTMILAKTFKGYGVSFLQDNDGWHGKPVKAGDDTERAIAELERSLQPVPDDAIDRLRAAIPKPEAPDLPAPRRPEIPPPSYTPGDLVATREAYGSALARIGQLDDRIVALDADVGNSTFSERFEKAAPERFFQHYIAEQVMVGAAMGLAARGALPFPSTFACFLTRAYDFSRMAAISNLNVKLAGSHAGVSIGEDGPSQMALEDLAMTRAEPNVTVLYPCDAVSAERCVELAAYQPGPVYIRTSRPKTPVIYEGHEPFAVGGSKVLRQSAADAAVVVAAGVTVFEALKAFDQLAAENIAIRVIDAYSVQPIDAPTLRAAARAVSGRVITVEDHYAAGGLGDAVASAIAPDGHVVHRLAVREIPRSGKPDELLDRFGISAAHVVRAVKALVGKALA
jgi:transketolase